jgi:hypothetical protein
MPARGWHAFYEKRASSESSGSYGGFPSITPGATNRITARLTPTPFLVVPIYLPKPAPCAETAYATLPSFCGLAPCVYGVTMSDNQP